MDAHSRIIAGSEFDEQMEVEDAESSPLPADGSALRESFGDRRVPEITRKITACAACRKQKVWLSRQHNAPQHTLKIYS
jgi:hypothetical protein